MGAPNCHLAHGVRRTGKTVLVRSIPDADYLDWELPGVRRRLATRRWTALVEARSSDCRLHARVDPRQLLSRADRGAAYNVDGMSLDDYKVVLYRNQPDGWVAEIPAIHGCYALMPTREDALAELANVFEMIAVEYAERGVPLPADSTAIVNA